MARQNISLLLFLVGTGCLRCAAFSNVHLPGYSVVDRRLHQLNYARGKSFDGDEIPSNKQARDLPHLPQTKSSTRRQVLLSLAAAIAMAPPIAASADTGSTLSPFRTHTPLGELLLGDGRWTKLDRHISAAGGDSIVPPSFCTYASRFLINYDPAVASWWDQQVRKFSLLPQEQKLAKLGQSFGSLSKTVQLAVDQFVFVSRESSALQKKYEQLSSLFIDCYGDLEDARQQIAILFALLPYDRQPVSMMKSIVSTTVKYDVALRSSQEAYLNVTSAVDLEDFSRLLPQNYRCVQLEGTSYYCISPFIPLFDVGVDEEFGQTATATYFGPMATSPLTRENPNYSLTTYGLFGLAGSIGCALTHTVVIPIDVVKTRNQVDPERFQNFLNTASLIFEEEGLPGLLLGAQATLAGYFWYGLSVYPSYTFFKRTLSLGLLPPEVAMLHSNDIALVAGALAAVVASLGLTPLEAARIRVVAEPERYRPLGLRGTLSAIALEDEESGWRSLYAGLPSLLTRQVIFGSVKFLAFEKACELLFSLYPFLRDTTWTSLGVSLLAGAFSGVLSSVVSQPADSVLTYVAQNKQGSTANLGVVEGCRVMVQKEGPGSLFNGLGSRCIWAGSIIAGQFLLYDVFRASLGVSSDDLSQVYQLVLPGSVN